MIWILTISACLISLGLNVWLIRENKRVHGELKVQREDNTRLWGSLKWTTNRINELRPKRDAHGRFTR